MPLTIEQVMSALAKVDEPLLGKSITELGLVKDVSIDNGEVRLTLELRASDATTKDASVVARRGSLGQAVRSALGPVEGVRGVEVRWKEDVTGRAVAADDLIPDVRNVILVMSGKGGVGK